MISTPTTLIGLLPDETLRISVFNPSGAEPEGRKYKTLVAPRIYLADGRLVAQADAVTLDPGESRVLDFKRADLQAAGEPGTGRLELRAQVESTLLIPQSLRSVRKPVPVGEVLDNVTGKTAVLIFQKPREIVVVGSK